MIHFCLLACSLAATLSMAGCSSQAEPDSPPPFLSEAETAQRAQTPAPDDSLLGFRLGQPLSLQACEGKEEAREHACIGAPGKVFIPFAERPTFFGDEPVNIAVDDEGRLQSLSFFMISDQAPRSALYEKFGPPDYVSEVALRTPSSGRQWNFSNLQVRWVRYGVDGEDGARVTARTGTERQRLDAEFEAEESRKRRL